MNRRSRVAGRLFGVALCGLAAAPAAAAAERELVAVGVASPPTIDGRGDDPCWAQTVPLVTRDPLAKIDIELRAVRTEDRIFLRARFPDPTESRDNQTLHWNEAKQKYDSGPEREDTLVLKWSMEPVPVDLTLKGDESYRADIWYWKAHRTDPVGYADDKVQVYSDAPTPGATRLLSGSGRAFFLTRDGDQGVAAYDVRVYESRDRDLMPKYAHQEPTGSRADVRAKGHWKDGFWTVEFGRLLDTGHPDDVPFDPAERYQFGVSRYEIAGRDPDPSVQEPLFGSGDVSETLWLVFR